MARQAPSIIRTAAQCGAAALVGGAAGALASRLMDELTVWRMKQKHGEGGELGLADLAEDVRFDRADLLAHFVVDNPENILNDLAAGTSIMKSIKGVRLPDGDTHMVGVVDRDGTPYYGVIWGLPPEGDDVDFDASVAAWRREVELYPAGEENLEKVEAVGGIFFYAGNDHPYADYLLRHFGADTLEDAEETGKKLREILRDFVSEEIYERRRKNIEEKFATDVDTLMLHLESNGSYLAVSPRRRARLLLDQL